jgi:hypothetical protein
MSGQTFAVFRRATALAWTVPIAYGMSILAIFFSLSFSPDILSQHRGLLIFMAPGFIVAPIGGGWALIQCLRHERDPRRYLPIILLVPFGFAWYYVERYRLRHIDALEGESRKSVPGI